MELRQSRQSMENVDAILVGDGRLKDKFTFIIIDNSIAIDFDLDSGQGVALGIRYTTGNTSRR